MALNTSEPTISLPQSDDEMSGASGDASFGRKVTLPIAQWFDPSGRWYTNNVGGAVDLVWATWATPRQATILLKVDGPLVAPGTQIFATISVDLGLSARFQRTVPILPGPATSLRVFGKAVHVSAFMVAPAGGTIGQTVSGALSEGDTNPLGDLVSVWNNPASGALGSPIVVGQTSNPSKLTAPGATGGGYLLGCSGFVRPSQPGTLGSAYFLQFYDVPIDSGDAYVGLVEAGLPPFFTLGPFMGALTPCPFSFDRSLRPSLRYVNGLAVALSSNDQGWAATDGAMQAILSWDLGL